MTSLLYDPPSGWRYGFPKPYKPLDGESLADTLLRDGYPQHEIDKGGAKYCRFIGGIDGAAQRHIEGANDNTRPVATATRRGDYMQTYTAGTFYPLDPRAEDVDIRDIAHALALQSRYGGHCLRYFSVAEHSVLIARWLLDNGHQPETALCGLLHDAAEAYLADVPRPLKRHLAGYKEAEDKVMAVIAERFGLPTAFPAIVKEADDRILADEVRQNMRPMAWHDKHDDPLGVRLECWEPGVAEIHFLDMFRRLKRERMEVAA